MGIFKSIFVFFFYQYRLNGVKGRITVNDKIGRMHTEESRLLPYMRY